MAIDAHADGPTVIRLQDHERDTGQLTPRHMFDAVTAWHRDGCVVLANAIETSIIDTLNERMTPDTEILKSNPDKIHWNQGRAAGNVSQNPPFERKYMFPQIYANRPAAAVMTNIFGPRPQLRYIRTNTLVGDTAGRQVVHKDCQFEHEFAPFHMALNIPLVDVSPQNGSTELWLGTSRLAEWSDLDITRPELGIRTEKLDERRKIRPPCYPEIKRGSLVLRDIRLWHAGMPNHTSETRVMLAFGYQAAWHGNDLRTVLPESLRDVVEGLEAHNNTEICGTFVPDDEYDNLYSEFQIDFSSAIKPERGSKKYNAERSITQNGDY